MQIIFLDIDGVLNNEESCQKRNEYYEKHKLFTSNIDEKTIKRLSEIVKNTGAKVVLSSSRRFDWKDGTDNIKLKNSKQLQQLFNKYDIEVIGITPNISKLNPCHREYNSWRETEIKLYLNQHPEIDNFCIIDDENFDLLTLKDNLIKTNGQYGLQDEHIEEAIKLLKKEKIKNLE